MAEETQMFLAKALYDNIAESPDELAFRRGDVVSVLEQDTGGLDGWWLCSLRGRQGIAPGNRLKIISGMMDGLLKGGNSSSNNQDAAKTEWMRSMEKSPSKVVTPLKKGDIYQYSQPNRSMEDYDVPPSRHFPSSKESSPEPGNGELYNIPSNLPAFPGSNSSSFYDTPPSSKRASSERTPPGSQRASMDSLSSTSSHSFRLSGEQQQSLYQTPPSSKRSSAEGGTMKLPGNERHYETPPGSKRASLERILSDDQPTYDTPTSSRSLELPGEATYDTPNPNSRRQSQDSTGMGNRTSTMSTASSESSSSSSHLVASRHSNAASLPDSARCSLDASLHESYDLPSRETRALKQLSMDSGLGLYDTPGLSRQSSSQPVNLSAISSKLSDYMHGDRPPLDIKRSRSLEHALDDLYDSPRSNALKVGLKSYGPAFSSTSAVNHAPNAVYDIPPQVTRDSIISARSDSSEESLRLSSCSMDSRNSGTELAEGVYEELLLDLDSALELLVKRQQNVTRAASRLLAFVSSTWRTKDSLQSNIYDIKVACQELKKAFGEFVDFAQGTLANSSRLPDRKLVNRLIKQVTPLQQERQAFSASLRSLEEMKWQVALLAEPLGSDAQDDLGTIISLAKDLGPEVKKLASLIQGNGTLIFKRSSDLAAQSRGSDNSVVVAAKPPIGPKPEVAPKPSAGGGNGIGIIIQRPRSVQQRPLPAPPVASSEGTRPLPPAPLKQKDMVQSNSLDSMKDYISAKGDVRRYIVSDDDPDGDRDYSVLQQEYDYVQLENCDVMAQKRSREEQQQQQNLKNTKEQQPEEPSTLTLEKSQASDDHKKDNVLAEMKPEPVRHTERVSADLGHHHHRDVDMVPTREDDTTNSRIGEDVPDGSENSDPEFPDDLKTPVNNKNGFRIPDEPPFPTDLDLSGTMLEASDKQVLCYYSGQLETHSTLLTNAIDAFFTCIENNEPPMVFISNSKFVIVTAHKLVYISDALHRSLINCEVRNKVMHCANHVCECLKVSVQATKMAALQYPSVPAVQEMVDRVVDVSHAAHELKLVITQASTL